MTISPTPGDERDVSQRAPGRAGAPLRIGHGYDLHRLERIRPAGSPGSNRPGEAGGRPLILAGVRLDHDHGPVGRSDGDTLYHAVTDALLGALAMPDIGQLFPDSDEANENRDSGDFVDEAMRRLAGAGWAPVNLDCTVILEKPKLSPHKESMRRNLAARLSLPIDAVNVKGKTHERVDAVGEGRAIEAHAVVLLMRTS